MPDKCDAVPYLTEAAKLLEKALGCPECKFCQSDIKLVLDAARDLQQIAEWAESLKDHPHRLKAVRALGAHLDRLRLLSLLVALSRNKAIKGILLLGSRNERD